MNRLIDPPAIKIAVQRMACTSCGAEANATCTCGVAYVLKSVRAAEAMPHLWQNPRAASHHR